MLQTLEGIPCMQNPELVMLLMTCHEDFVRLDSWHLGQVLQQNHQVTGQSGFFPTNFLPRPAKSGMGVKTYIKTQNHF